MVPVLEQNYYQRLGVTPSAAPDQIKRAYRAWLLQAHPALHKGMDPADFQLIKRAYEVLANPDERRRYDMLTGLGSHAQQPHVYRRSYGLVQAALDAGLKASIVSFDELAEQLEVPRRRAG